MLTAHDQNIEATALRLFDDNGELAHMPLTGNITIPKVIHYDEQPAVLVIEDLGELGTLWDLLDNRTCSEAVKSGQAQLLHYMVLGHRVGTFFGHLHSLETFAKVGENESAAASLTHSLTTELVFNAAVQPIRERLDQYGTPNAEVLAWRVTQDYREPKYTYPPAMSLGDFHPGSILVQDWYTDPKAVGDAAAPPRLAIIDWEFAALNGRGVNGDVAQFLASLHCHIVSLQPDDVGLQATALFIQGFAGAYGKVAALDFQMTPENTALQLLRSYLILHGREMINQAFEREWGVEKEVLAKMVAVGASYIDMAGDSAEELLEKNWSRLMENDHGVVANLFGITNKFTNI